ncbi:MAG: polymerase subunit alpha, polymerase subunit alpha protein [Candidatus Doudnabacteria bacterium]|nr:polymerase subunit alpha, polymerase subunit alpha protein [Candidatus Doudnabacteria bacterium]
MKFTHLHVHSHFSLLDGLSQIEPLLERAQALNFEALALTDHGVMYGAIEFYNKALELGIKPIIGFEAYIAIRDLTDKQVKVDDDYYHLTLIAKNYEGYKNLIQLTTTAHLDGYYYKPRIDKNLMRKYSAGIIALSGCPRGEIYKAIKNKSLDAAEQVLSEYVDIFGKENFFLEVQRNERGNRDATNEKIIQGLVTLAKKNGLGIVATADCHYINKSDSEAQDVLVCIGTGKTVQDSDRLDMTGFDLSLRSADEMAELFKDLPEAIENTQKIADMCNLEIPINQRYFPVFVTPAGETPEEFLRTETFHKALKFYGIENPEDKNGPKILPPNIIERLEYELNIIVNKGFSTYFLVLADIVNAAHEMGVITNTRGSAAGSMVGYVIGITNVDPIVFQLPFERFLTMHRPTPPDIDLDIADNRRDDVIVYITAKYGREKVAQIITFGTMKARAAVRDVGRALAVPYGKCDRIAKMIPLGKQGFDMTIAKALDISAELREVYKKDEETKKLIDIAKILEGGARHASVHAAGIVITPTQLIDYVPLQKEPDGERMITQFDMYALDVNANGKAIGVIKIDLLGIRNLSILEEALKIVEARHGVKVDIYNLPHPDKKTFELLAAGHTFGVFQLGSSGMTRYLKELQPKTIFDIMAMIALYRPGPLQFIPLYIERAHNPRLVTYLDPMFEKILNKSYGVLVYQDDLLSIAHDIAGYTWEEVDKFRKAVGKKIPEEMQKQKEKFTKGCISHSKFSAAKADEIWSWIEPFAAYGFNKSHSASYSMVSYQTAYMKANYSVEFMAAVMTAESGDAIKIYEAVEECKKMGINVLPPDVNESLNNFTVIDEHNIRFGLTAIKNLGSDVVDQIKEQRKIGGQFTSLKDFISRMQTRNFNKKSWEALVKCGALDNFGERNQLLHNTEHVLEYVRELFKSKQSGQDSLFGGMAIETNDLTLSAAPPASQDEMLLWEKELLGLYVSSHPLENYKKVFTQIMKIGQLNDEMIEKNVTVGGIISKIKKSLTKKQEPMIFLTLEDKTGIIEALLFPKTLAKVNNLIEMEKIVQMSGRLSDKDGEFKLIVDDVKDLPNDMIYDMNISDFENNSMVNISLPEKVSRETMDKIKTILEKYPGNAAVKIIIVNNFGTQIKTLPTKIKVGFSDEMLFELRLIKEIARVQVQNGEQVQSNVSSIE